MSSFPTLFSPGSLGRLELPNRIVMPAMEPGLADGDGRLDDSAAGAYYALRARGGAGLIITGNVAVQPHGRAAGVQPGLWCDEQVPAFRATVAAVHAAGGRMAVQISHAGREVHPMLGWEAVGPSAVQSPALKSTPREMTEDDILACVAAFADAARRAVEAGADAVEIHGAHGYLVNQFLSPLMNVRTDSWGGDTAGRSRFAIEVVSAVRRAVGPGFPVLFRLTADEYVPGGMAPDEAAEVAGLMEEAGADAISVSACTYESAFYNLPNYYLEEGCFVALARRVAEEVRVPVIAVGRIRRPAMAEEILVRGDADFVAMGRSLIADPFLPAKARDGREDEIRPCLSCNRCLDSLSTGPMACAVNPWLRDEVWPRPVPSAPRGEALVAGSGPGGLTAAMALAWQGHRVTVHERDAEAGGKLLLAGLPPRKGAVAEFRHWLEDEARRAGVEIRLSDPLTVAAVLERRPDVTVVATGSAAAPPPFAVAEGAPVVSVEEAFLAPERLGRRVCIIGGGAEGAELADFLSEGGQSVVLLEAKRKVARDILPALRHFLLQRLEEKDVEVVTRFAVTEVGAGWVAGKLGASGTERLEGFDAVVVATGLRPFRGLADDLEAEGVTVRVVGDAATPRSILEAVREGAAAAR